MITRQAIQKTFAVVALLGLPIGVYRFAIRPRQLRWGATPQELACPLPGDNLVPNPNFYATRAVTIEGRPEDIWPWIVQIGYGRAGFYGYDLIENLGSKRGIRSAREIIPELQGLKAGDRVYMSAIAYLVVHSMTTNKFLIWTGDQQPPGSAFTWALIPVDHSHTRLVSRFRFRYGWTDLALPLELFTEFGDHIAVPKMLLGIKDRVEGRPIAPLAEQAAEIGVWLAGSLEFAIAFVLVFVWRQWRGVWVIAMLAGFTVLFALYAREPSWIGALLEAVILVAVVWLWHAQRQPQPAHEPRLRR